MDKLNIKLVDYIKAEKDIPFEDMINPDEYFGENINYSMLTDTRYYTKEKFDEL